MSTGNCSSRASSIIPHFTEFGVSCWDAIQPLLALKKNLDGIHAPFSSMALALPILAAPPPSVFTPALLERAAPQDERIVNPASLRNFATAIVGQDLEFALRFWLERAKVAGVGDDILAREILLAIQKHQDLGIDERTNLMLLHCVKYLAVTHAKDGAIPDLSVSLQFLLEPDSPEYLRSAAAEILVLVAYQNLECGQEQPCYNKIQTLLAKTLPNNEAVITKLADLLVQFIQVANTPQSRERVLAHLIAAARCLLVQGASDLQIERARRLLGPVIRRTIEIVVYPTNNGECSMLLALAETLLIPEMSSKEIVATETIVKKLLEFALAKNCQAASLFLPLADQTFAAFREPPRALALTEPISILRYANIAKVLMRSFSVEFLRQHEALIRQTIPYLSLKAQSKFWFWLGQAILKNEELSLEDRRFALSFFQELRLPQFIENPPGLEDFGKALFFSLENTGKSPLLPRTERDLAKNILLRSLESFTAQQTKSGLAVVLLKTLASLANNEQLDPDERRCYREALLQPGVLPKLLPSKYLTTVNKLPFEASIVDPLVTNVEALHNQAATKEMVRWLNGTATMSIPNSSPQLQTQLHELRQATQRHLLRIARTTDGCDPSLRLDLFRAMAKVIARYDLPIEERAPLATFCLAQEQFASQRGEEDFHSCLVHILGKIMGAKDLSDLHAQALPRIEALTANYARLPVKVRAELLDAISAAALVSSTPSFETALQAAKDETEEPILQNFINLLFAGYVSQQVAPPQKKEAKRLINKVVQRFPTLPPKIQNELIVTIKTLSARCSDEFYPQILAEIGQKISMMPPPLREELVTTYASSLCEANTKHPIICAKLAEQLQSNFRNLPKPARAALLAYLQSPQRQHPTEVLAAILQATFWPVLENDELTTYVAIIKPLAFAPQASNRRKAQNILSQIFHADRIESRAFIPVLEDMAKDATLASKERQIFFRNFLKSPGIIIEAPQYSKRLRQTLTLVACETLTDSEQPSSPIEIELLVMLLKACGCFLEEPENTTEEQALIAHCGALANQLPINCEHSQILRTQVLEFLRKRNLTKALGNSDVLRSAIFAAYSQVIDSPTITPEELLPFHQNLIAPAALKTMLSCNIVDRLAYFHFFCRSYLAEREPSSEQRSALAFLSAENTAERLFAKLGTVIPETLHQAVADVIALNNRELTQQFIGRLVTIEANGVKSTPALQQAVKKHLASNPAMLLELLQGFAAAAAQAEEGPPEKSSEALAELLNPELTEVCLRHPDLRVRQSYIEQINLIAAKPLLTIDYDNEELLQGILLRPNHRSILLSLNEPPAVLLTLILLGRLLEDPTNEPILERLLREEFIPYFSNLEHTEAPDEITRLLQKTKKAISSKFPEILPPTVLAEAPDRLAVDDTWEEDGDITPPPHEISPPPPQIYTPPPSPVPSNISSRSITHPPIGEPPRLGILPTGSSLTNKAVTIAQPDFLQRDLERIGQFRRVKYHPLQLQLNQLREEATAAFNKRRGGKQYRQLTQEFYRVQQQFRAKAPKAPGIRSKHDNTPFSNICIEDSRPLLEIKRGSHYHYYYTEYVCEPGEETGHRLVIGEKGEIYYTDGHYDRGTFYFFGYLPTLTPPRPVSTTPPPSRTPTPLTTPPPLSRTPPPPSDAPRTPPKKK